MPFMVPGILMPWVASGLIAASAVFVLFLCVCRGNKEKVADHGMPGVVHAIDIDKPLLEKSNGQNLRSSVQQDEDAHEKTRTVAERALPDIPRVLQAGNSITDTDTDHTPDSGSECYATVAKPVDALVPEIHIGQVRNGRLPSSRFSQPPENLSLEKSENHMYAQVSKHDKNDRRHTVHCANNLNEASYPSTSAAVSPPPLPEPEFIRLSSSEVPEPYEQDESETTDSEPLFSTAGQAVAGNVPSAEIPYMTPPVLAESSLAHSAVDENQSPYTTISVREPLERVKKQIIRQQIRQMTNRNPSTEEQEGVYTEVPDDQTYAEIDSGQTSAESSTTYDQIEPRIQDFPPDPPTVESLKTVAQAHSRQASIASVSSTGSGNDSSSVGRDIAALYSVVDKSGKQRQTIHIAENINVHHSTEEGSKKVEDMYAKVCKKKASNSQGTSGVLENLLGFDGSRVVDDVFVSPRSSWSPGSSHSRSPPLPPPLPAGPRLQVASESDSAQKLTRRHSADPSYMESNYNADEPEQGYATVGRSDSPASSSYEKIPFDSDDPGYERIKKDFADVDPHYELIGHLQKSDQSSSDPGYEHVPRRHVEKSDLIEPGYEQIRKLDRYDSDAVDPGYEKVRRIKRDTENNDPLYDYIPNLSRTDSDSGASEYEKIQKLSRHDSDTADPGYERVKLKKTENGQVSRVSIKMDGSLVIQNAAGNESPSYLDQQQRSYLESNAVDDSADVITVSECPEKISICINFKPISESAANRAKRMNSVGMNGDGRVDEQFDNGQNSDQSLGIQTATHSNSLSSGDGEDRRSCTATQNSTGYETASSGESISSVNGLKKRRVLVSSSTQEVTTTNSRGSAHRISQQTEKNVWENGQQVYKQANYSVQTGHEL